MGTKLLKAAIITVGIGLFLPTITFACDNEPDGSLSPRFIVLSATAEAPAGAKGFAAVSFGICGGTNAPTLRVGTEGLLVGTYAVSVTDNTGSNSFELGTFDVHQLLLASSTLQWTNWAGGVTVGGARLPLPDGFDATNGFSVSIADSNTVVDLTGTFGSFTNAPPPHNEFRAVALLAATTNAPDGAVGRAVLKVEDDEDDDASAAEVRIVTIGLSNGTYTATVTDPNTNEFILGTFDVGSHTDDDEDDQGDDDSQGDEDNRWAAIAIGRAEFPVPAGLDASNVVSISISDSNSVVDLVGDFVTPIPCDFLQHVRLVPGPTCTNLHGSAELHLKFAKGKPRGKFSLIARGVPAGQKLQLFVNGVSAGTVKSNRQGKLAIKRLPKTVDVMAVTTVQVRDKSGRVVFTANF